LGAGREDVRPAEGVVGGDGECRELGRFRRPAWGPLSAAAVEGGEAFGGAEACSRSTFAPLKPALAGSPAALPACELASAEVASGAPSPPPGIPPEDKGDPECPGTPA